LFETGAISVAPEDKPFWYTSGTIGPYYSNTHFLIGGETDAAELLSLIDAGLGGDRRALPAVVARYVYDIYDKGECYKTVADCIYDYVINNIDIGSVDYISGGARRDWFFSYIAARIFNKPHLTIFKDLSVAVNDAPPDGPFNIAKDAGPDEFAGAVCLHISDCVNEASSYARAWAPALAKTGARIGVSLTMLDRSQGGGAVLASLGVKHAALASIDAEFFTRALAAGYINDRQYLQILRYIEDPNGTMRAFLKARPEFMEAALAAGGKQAERARICIDSGVYGGGNG
jgi:hypothetical protein